MKSHAEQPKPSESKPPAKDDLKSLPLPELKEKLVSSPEGFGQTEAQRRVAKVAALESEKTS